MQISTKIYLSFLGLLILILFALFFVGINTNNKAILQIYQSTQTQQNKKKIDLEDKAELNKLHTRLKELEKINQQNIKNSKKIKEEEDKQLSQQINYNLAKIKILQQEIHKLHKQLEEQNIKLNTKKTNLNDEDKKSLEIEINNLNQEINDLNQQKEKLNAETQPLTPKRTEIIKSQSKHKKIIQTTPSEINKTTNFQSIYQEITKLQEAMSYNNANKNLIQELIVKNQNNPQEIQNLKSYELFLDSQLLTFSKQITQLQNKIEKLKSQTHFNIQKQIKTFKNVYGMGWEKNQFTSIINYFKDKKHILGYKNIKPMGILLYGPHGAGKSHLIEALCGELGVHFIKLGTSKCDKTYIGEDHAELEKIWQEAESHDKAIIFIDEISGLANSENKNSNQSSINIVNNLLNQLDIFQRSDKKIILMAATNHLEQIDESFKSRFKNTIKIDSFKINEIEGFLKYLCLQKDFLISYHTFTYFKEIINCIKNNILSNRDWTRILDDAFANYSIHKNENHEVILPSDLDEAIYMKLSIRKDDYDITKRRQECEEQYASWKQGILKYLEPPKDHTMIKITYNFYGFNGIGRGQYPENEPKNIDLFIKKPFINWQATQSIQDEYLVLCQTKNKYKESKFFPDHSIKNKSNHYIEISYEGPAYLLKEDKDFFMDEVQCLLKEKDKNGIFISKSYYLHFNPKQAYITLYNQKHNTK
jgi:SpoVK/Ycf46/Vps4 family AAA+-type ATPase